MAELTRRVTHHDCRDELKQLDEQHKDAAGNFTLGTGSRATCSCGQRWYVGAPIEQLFAAAITRTRWLRVPPLEADRG